MLYNLVPCLTWLTMELKGIFFLASSVLSWSKLKYRPVYLELAKEYAIHITFFDSIEDGHIGEEVLKVSYVF
ncbi:unnamed protein product [Protopolystoma xenopodis]|uniref:Uncharacterized protein n=1 Tax=Protopolystoma xenopodis TaxID=117903 RepID=A0A3S5B3L4_9PLAT|nr:unnamed protein product [Protopolystoma xenopodis]